MDIRDRVAQLPISPGVYLYKDTSGTYRFDGREVGRIATARLFPIQ